MTLGGTFETHLLQNPLTRDILKKKEHPFLQKRTVDYYHSHTISKREHSVLIKSSILKLVDSPPTILMWNHVEIFMSVFSSS